MTRKAISRCRLPTRSGHTPIEIHSCEAALASTRRLEFSVSQRAWQAPQFSAEGRLVYFGRMSRSSGGQSGLVHLRLSSGSG